MTSMFLSSGSPEAQAPATNSVRASAVSIARSVVGLGANPESYQMIQSLTVTVAGVSIDPDTTQTDKEGGQVMWLVKTPVPPLA
jgi:hypothetical protein